MKWMYLFIVLLTVTAVAQEDGEIIDRVIAVVDDEIILKSEVDFQAQSLAYQQKLDPANPQLHQRVLKAMVEDKLVLAQAELDSVEVSDDEVDRQVEYQMAGYEQRFGSRDRVEEIFKMSWEKMRRELRESVRKQLLIDRVRQMTLGQVDASRRQVEDFFATYKDSLELIPEKVTISHIFINPHASKALKKQYRAKAEAIRDSLINHGADFEAMAKKYSEDPGSAPHGGDLGYAKRGVLVPQYESVAFQLGKNEISQVVESPFGFHIIQTLDRRGESVHSRHILIKVKANEDTDLQVIEELTAIRDSILSGEGTFEEFAKKYSDDDETANFGGSLGTWFMNELDENLRGIVSKLEEGEISFPRRMTDKQGEYGYHIVYLKERIPQHEPSLELDYKDIKSLVELDLREEMYQEWIKEIKKNVYWEMKTEEEL